MSLSIPLLITSPLSYRSRWHHYPHCSLHWARQGGSEPDVSLSSIFVNLDCSWWPTCTPTFASARTVALLHVAHPSTLAAAATSSENPGGWWQHDSLGGPFLWPPQLAHSSEWTLIFIVIQCLRREVWDSPCPLSFASLSQTAVLPTPDFAQWTLHLRMASIRVQ